MGTRNLVLISLLVLISESSIFAQDFGNRIDPESMRFLKQSQVEWLRNHRPKGIYIIDRDSSGNFDTTLGVTFEYPGNHVRVTDRELDPGEPTTQEYDGRDSLFEEQTVDTTAHFMGITKYDSMGREISYETTSKVLATDSSGLRFILNAEHLTYIDQPNLTRIIDDHCSFYSADSGKSWMGGGGTAFTDTNAVEYYSPKRRIDSIRSISYSTFFYYDRHNNLICERRRDQYGNKVDSFSYYSRGAIAQVKHYELSDRHEILLKGSVKVDIHGNVIQTTVDTSLSTVPVDPAVMDGPLTIRRTGKGPQIATTNFSNEYDTRGRPISIACKSDSSVKKFYWNDDDSFAGWDSFINGKIAILDGATVASEHYIYKF